MIAQKSQSNLVAVLIQILIWLVLGLALMFYQPFPGDIAVPYQLWIKQAVVLALLAGAYYLNSTVLVPAFLLKNRGGYYLLLIVLVICGILLLNAYTEKLLNIHQLMDAAFHQHGPPRPHRDHGGGGGPHFDTITLMIIALVLGISTSVTTIQKWQADKQHNQVLQQEKTSSELSFLKAQINPHFFFNTLNNIYALTHIDAETSRKAIHQLSRMMRYLLYDTQQTHTLLSQEIAFIKDYISLMQLRLTDVVQISFESPEPLIDMPIAPMIFLPFVENAFKHGISVTQPSKITISITQEDMTLKLSVKNSIIKDQGASLDEYSGIGLNNTRRRLDLLYPGKYNLLINELTTENEYHVHLFLNLA
jgi:two-component system LytT family sensor kinase